MPNGESFGAAGDEILRRIADLSVQVKNVVVEANTISNGLGMLTEVVNSTRTDLRAMQRDYAFQLERFAAVENQQRAAALDHGRLADLVRDSSPSLIERVAVLEAACARQAEALAAVEAVVDNRDSAKIQGRYQLWGSVIAAVLAILASAAGVIWEIRNK